MNAPLRIASSMALVTMLAACSGSGDIVVDEGVGITALRTVCPAVGVPDYTGDITTFRGGDTTAAAIDVSAALTNVRSTCDDTGAKIYTNATFDVLARRTDTRGARRVELPFFSTVLRGNTAVVSKRIGTVVIDFADGQERAQGSGTAGAFVDREASTLPDEIRREITRKREAGDEDAALDPLSKPEVRAALSRATFEVLVGFQLNEQQFAYNVTR
ncbi:hypothetical protein [Altererythrobacter aquiaggeris]|uniref:hypothetical protein n=1 Tax=Aestuarierythrobacter aquiaggeris TaxID=1898396 RepID=UPI00301914F4